MRSSGVGFRGREAARRVDEGLAGEVWEEELGATTAGEQGGDAEALRLREGAEVDAEARGAPPCTIQSDDSQSSKGLAFRTVS